MDLKELNLVKGHLLMRRLAEPPKFEEDWFKNEASLPAHAESNIKARLLFLKAFQALVGPILERHLDKASLNRALEVGCGTGFFSRYLAPTWLNQKLTVLDINAGCLSLAREKRSGDYPNVLLTSTYHLPFAPQCFDAVIGYSSFDSYLFLAQAMAEAKRVLKPGKPLILFQDLTTQTYDLEEKPSTGEHIKTFAWYHAILVETAKRLGLQIIAGEKDEGVLTTMQVEKIVDVRGRVPDFDIKSRKFPVFIRWDKGVHGPPVTRSDRQFLGVTKKSIDKKIDTLGKKLAKRPLPDNLRAGPDDLIEWATMRYLVAKKLN